MSNRREDRPALNLRVNVRVKAAFEREIVERHGMLRPYAGVTLENELAALVGSGRLGDLIDSVHRLADALGETAVQKKTQTPTGGEATVVRYRIKESVREDVMQLAKQADVTYPRDLVERVMWDYAQGRSSVDKAVDRMGRIRDHAESELGASDSTTERRAMTIANVFQSDADEADDAVLHGFSLSDFDKVVDNQVKGIGSGSYARSQYLRPVLDELGYTWHPNGDIFVSHEHPQVPDGDRDPRTKPYLLMDHDDKLAAMRTEAVETAQNATENRTKYTTSEGVSTLEGKPSKATVEHMLRELADDDDRFTWKDSLDAVRVDAKPKSNRTAMGGTSGTSMDQLTAATPAHEVDDD